MKAFLFEPKDFIEEYLDRPTNLEIYQGLLNKGFIDPLAFFNLLYEQFEIIIENQAAPLKLKEHLKDLDIEKKSYFFLLTALSKLMNEKITSSEIPEKDRLLVCLELINELSSLPIEGVPEPEVVVFPYSWDKIKTELNKKSGLIKKLNYLLRMRGELKNKSKTIAAGLGFENNFELHISLVNNEIEYLKGLLEIKHVEKPESNPSKKPFGGSLINKTENNDEEFLKIQTRNIIKRCFNESFGEKGWGDAFRSKADYSIFVEALVSYFSHENVNLPSNINLKTNCQTKTALALRAVHKELSEQRLKNDKRFFEIVKTLSPFSKMTEPRLYKTLTR